MTSGKKMIFGILAAVFFSGCSGKLIAIGEVETYCDENCGKYKDAGVCAAPYDIFVNRSTYAARAEYVNKNCRKCK